MSKEKETVGEMALKAAVYTVVGAALKTKDHNVQLRGAESDPDFFVAVLQADEMEAVLKFREDKKAGGSHG